MKTILIIYTDMQDRSIAPEIKENLVNTSSKVFTDLHWYWHWCWHCSWGWGCMVSERGRAGGYKLDERSGFYGR
jgi:hypothetical protein